MASSLAVALVGVIILSSCIHAFERREKRRLEEALQAELSRVAAAKAGIKFQLALARARKKTRTRERAPKRPGQALTTATTSSFATIPQP